MNEVTRYIRKIRHPAKRAYAHNYWLFLNGHTRKPPDCGALGMMAAQAADLPVIPLPIAEAKRQVINSL